jgi:glutathione peroxidase
MKSPTKVSVTHSILFAGCFLLVAACAPEGAQAKPAKSLHDLTVTTIDGKKKNLSDYKGKVVLVVNTASQCGYTRQYAGLQTLYKKMAGKGFEVLAFPSNDFGEQEPGTEAEIKQFCETRYKTTFPLFSKVHATGKQKSSIYRFLTESGAEPFRGDVRWNFTKFLVNKSGQVVGRYESHVDPGDAKLAADIQKSLAAK